jgi:cytochrome b
MALMVVFPDAKMFFKSPSHYVDFIPRKSQISRLFPFEYLNSIHKAVRQGRHPQYLGHNPVAALMMLGLMLLILLLGGSGWLQGTDAFFGEEWLMELHEVLANGLLLAAGLHAAAALVMGRLERVGLVRAMITGVKQSY